MPNWVSNQIRFIGDRDNIASVLKLVIVDKDFLETLKKGEFNLCEHVQSHASYNDEDRKICDKCEHGKFCPLLSPKGSDVTVWEMAKVDEYGLHPSHFQEGDIYFGILIPQPRGMFQGATNSKIQKRNARFGIEDWFDWNVENWGTKWNPNPDETTLEWLDDTTAELCFPTAWSLPEPWLTKLAEECRKHGRKVLIIRQPRILAWDIAFKLKFTSRTEVELPSVSINSCDGCQITSTLRQRVVSEIGIIAGAHNDGL